MDEEKNKEQTNPKGTRSSTTPPPCFVLPRYKDSLRYANEDGPAEWKLFHDELPPIDKMIWIIDKAGAVCFGCRREYGMMAMLFKDTTPIAWKIRTIGAPGIVFE